MSTRRSAAVDVALVAGLVAAELALAARLLSTDTFFDEGVYLLALDALLHGQELGTDVFGAQPPGYYDFLRLVAAVVDRSIESIRLAHVLVICCGVLGAYLVARSIGGRIAAVAAGAAVVIAYPLPLLGPRVLADGPALGLALLAAGLAASAARPLRSTALVTAAGAAIAAATSLKLYAPLAMPTIVLLLQRLRPMRDLAALATGAACVGAALAALHASALPEIWEGAVSYHNRAQGFGYLDNVHEVREVLNPRFPATWLAAAGVLLAVGRLRRHPRATVALWAWPVLGLALVLWHDPLLEAHLLVFALPLALAAGATLGAAAAGLAGRRRAAAAAVLVVVLAAGYVQAHRRAASEHRPEEPGILWAGGILAAQTRPGDVVASDLPLAPFLADRRVPGDLVDTAMLRFTTGSLTRARVLRTLEEQCVQAVVAGRVFRVLPGFRSELAARFRRSLDEHGVTVYLEPRRADCG